MKSVTNLLRFHIENDKNFLSNESMLHGESSLISFVIKAIHKSDIKNKGSSKRASIYKNKNSTLAKIF